MERLENRLKTPANQQVVGSSNDRHDS